MAYAKKKKDTGRFYNRPVSFFHFTRINYFDRNNRSAIEYG